MIFEDIQFVQFYFFSVLISFTYIIILWIILLPTGISLSGSSIANRFIAITSIGETDFLRIELKIWKDELLPVAHGAWYVYTYASRMRSLQMQS